MKLGNVIEEIIYDSLELFDNDIVLTEQLFEVVAKATDVSEEFIIEELKKVNSLLTANNAIQGFTKENGKWNPWRRLTIFSKTKKIIGKHLAPYEYEDQLYMTQVISASAKVEPLYMKSFDAR